MTSTDPSGGPSPLQSPPEKGRGASTAPLGFALCRLVFPASVESGLRSLVDNGTSGIFPFTKWLLACRDQPDSP